MLKSKMAARFLGDDCIRTANSARGRGITDPSQVTTNPSHVAQEPAQVALALIRHVTGGTGSVIGGMVSDMDGYETPRRFIDNIR